MKTSQYHARFADSAPDIEAAQRLRHQAFIAKRGTPARPNHREVDRFDGICTHVLIEDRVTHSLVATFRLLPLTSGADIAQSYSAQYYDLNALRAYDKPMVEMGRFCVRPGCDDPDILRVAWGVVTKFVDSEGVGLLFGCSSFHGTNADVYADAFAMLRDRHLAPKRWLPRIKAPNVVRFAQRLRGEPDQKTALRTMPPLLRSYLTMGGWVSDHAVIDRDLDTLHVFTGLEVCAVPAARARALRAVAG